MHRPTTVTLPGAYGVTDLFSGDAVTALDDVALVLDPKGDSVAVPRVIADEDTLNRFIRQTIEHDVKRRKHSTRERPNVAAHGFVSDAGAFGDELVLPVRKVGKRSNAPPGKKLAQKTKKPKMLVIFPYSRSRTSP